VGSEWTQQELDRRIADKVEEGQSLEYKAAGALGKSDGKKREITKDVSAMANAAGGEIIYGIKEYDEKDRRHLPEKIDPIDRLEFSKEWLEQVIGGIAPRIEGLRIYPVDLDTGATDVAYVVEIPQSMTAHQANDFRYYQRQNFRVVPMHDYQIRDVMNRGIAPSATVEFTGVKVGVDESRTHHYKLQVVVRNEGVVVIEAFKLQFLFPRYAEGVGAEKGSLFKQERIGVAVDNYDEGRDVMIVVRSKERIFPKDYVDLTSVIGFKYHWSQELLLRFLDSVRAGEMLLRWTLYADSMPFKEGEIALAELVVDY